MELFPLLAALLQLMFVRGTVLPRGTVIYHYNPLMCHNTTSPAPRQRRDKMAAYLRTRRHPIVQHIFKRSLEDELRESQPPTYQGVDNVENRSLCPWTYIRDYNSTRFPRNMFRAVCTNNGVPGRCDFSSFNPRNDTTFGNLLTYLASETQCALIYSQIQIIVECCDPGYTQKLVWIQWPVGCACSKPKTENINATVD